MLPEASDSVGWGCAMRMWWAVAAMMAKLYGTCESASDAS